MTVFVGSPGPFKRSVIHRTTPGAFPNLAPHRASTNWRSAYFLYCSVSRAEAQHKDDFV